MYSPYVPTARVRPIVERLLADGHTYTSIEKKAGLSPRLLYDVMNGRREHVRFETVDRLLTRFDMLDLWRTELEDIYARV